MKVLAKFEYREVTKVEIQAKRKFWFGTKPKTEEHYHLHIFFKEIDVPPEAVTEDCHIHIEPFKACRTVWQVIYNTNTGRTEVWVNDISHKARPGMKSLTEDEAKEKNQVYMRALEQGGWKDLSNGQS